MRDTLPHVTLNYPVLPKVVWKRLLISDETLHLVF
jgi:hypothetical protein